MKTFQGTYDGPQPITEDTLVEGHLEGEVRIGDGVTVNVDGMISGSLWIGVDARLDVRGMFNSAITVNQGVITVGGMITSTPWRFPGRLLVQAGTMLTAAGASILEEDGTLRRLPPGKHEGLGLGESEVYLEYVLGRWEPVA